jgi:hypothetical protein
MTGIGGFVFKLCVLLILRDRNSSLGLMDRAGDWRSIGSVSYCAFSINSEPQAEAKSGDDTGRLQ